MQMDRRTNRTDMTKLLVTFCNFANTPKNRKMVVCQKK